MDQACLSEPKVPVVRRPDYTLYLERAHGKEWIHCDVIRWSAVVKRQMQADFDALFALHGGPIFALSFPRGNEKRQKFMRSMGLSFDGSFHIDDAAFHIFARY